MPCKQLLKLSSAVSPPARFAGLPAAVSGSASPQPFKTPRCPDTATGGCPVRKQPATRFTRNAYLLFFLALGTIAAQNHVSGEEHIFFEQMSLEQGIAHNTVFNIFQDSHGYMWFGSMYGLIKYDGVRYTTWRHDPRDPASLSHDDIISIFEDSRGLIWAASWNGGLNCLDPASGVATRFLHQPADSNSIGSNLVLQMAETADRQGRLLWFACGEAGLYQLDMEAANPAFRRISLGLPEGQSGYVATVLPRDSESLWAGSRAGLLLLNRDGVQQHFHRGAREPLHLPSDAVNYLYRGEQGQWWVGLANNGLLRLDPAASRPVREHLRHQPGVAASLAGNTVTAIAPAGGGSLWIGSYNGLTLLKTDSLQENRFRHFYSDPQIPGSLSSNNIVALRRDSTGVLWIGSYNGGVDRYVPGKRKFPLLQANPRQPHSLPAGRIDALARGRDGRLWVAASSGGLKHSRERSVSLSNLDALQFETPEWFRTAGRGSPPVITALAPRQADNGIWLGSNAGLFLLNADGTLRRHFQAQPDNPHALSSNAVAAVLEDSRGDLWVATGNGLNRLPAGAAAFQRFFKNPRDSLSLGGNWLLSLYEDPQGSLWIGGYHGLSRYNRSDNSFRNWRHQPDNPGGLSNNYVYNMLQDSHGRFWIGTAAGLNLFSPVNGSARHFRIEDGLPNDVICAIAEAPRGGLWISTHRGLVWFDALAGKMVAFDAYDGLQSNLFTPGAVCRLTDSSAVFGGLHGLNGAGALPPERAADKAPLVIGSMYSAGRQVRLTGAATPELDWSGRDVQFTFALLDYAAPEKHRYFCRLTGQDNQWNYLGNKTEAAWTNLAPGSYRLEIRGADSPSLPGPAQASLAFVVRAPFWMRGWFYALLGGLILAVLLLAYHARIRWLIRQTLLVQRLRQFERECMREKAARDFHDQLGHQLTKIAIYSDLLRQRLTTTGAEGELAGYLEKIAGASQRLGSDTRDFIWALHPGKDSLSDLQANLSEFAAELFEDTGIDIAVIPAEGDCQGVQLSMDWRRHLMLIFKEAMHNALKHSGCRSVCLQATCRDGILELRFSDDGCGFDAHQQLTGNGLGNMRRRAEKLGGSLTIEALAPQGSSLLFRACLPHAPSPDEREIGTRRPAHHSNGKSH